MLSGFTLLLLDDVITAGGGEAARMPGGRYSSRGAKQLLHVSRGARQRQHDLTAIPSFTTNLFDLSSQTRSQS